MKTIKRSLSIFLSVVLIFSSFSILSSAVLYDGNENSWEIATRYFRWVDANADGIEDEDEWIETSKVARGERIRARIFVETDYAVGSSEYFWLFTKKFFTVDETGYEIFSTMGDGRHILYTITNTHPDSPSGNPTYGHSGQWTYAYDPHFSASTEAFLDDMYYDGNLDDSDFVDHGYVDVQQIVGKKAHIYNGEHWIYEIRFIVNDDATGLGNMFVAEDTVQDATEKHSYSRMFLSKQPAGDGGGMAHGALGGYSQMWDWKDIGTGVTADNTVTFNAGAGKFSDDETAKTSTGYIGEALDASVIPADPTASGQNFLGWVPSTVEAPTAADIVDASAILYDYEATTYNALYENSDGTYTVNVYTMGLDGNYGDPVTTTPGASVGQEVSYTAAAPEGFTIDAEISTLTGTVLADNSTTLNVYLSRNKYDVTFDGVTENLYYGAAITAPTAAEKEGYVFDGWYAGDVAFAEGATVPVGGTEYTSKYSAAENVVNVVANYTDAVTGEPATVSKEFATVTGNTVAIVDAIPAEPAENTTYILYSELPAAEHYAFDAANEANQLTATVAADGSTVMNVQFSAVDYTAAFDAGDGTPTEITQAYYSTFNAPAAPEKAGYTFDGWFDASGNEFVDGVTNLTGNVTYTAKYTAIDYNVTYSLTGDVPDGVTAPAAVKANIGDDIVLPEVAPVTGYTFNGWTVTGGVDGKVGAEDVTVVGDWSINTYKVNYYIDDAKTRLYTTQTYAYGDSVIAPEDPKQSDIGPGKEFTDWDYIPATMPDGDVDVVAILTDIDYFVDFIGLDSVVLDTAIRNYGDVIELADAPDATTEGYDFNGWTYLDGSPVTFPITIRHDTEIYASYTVQSYNATFYLDDAMTEVHAVVPTNYGEEIVVPADPTKEGYTFDMWDPEPSIMEAEDMSFVASWSVNNYDITWNVDGVTTTESKAFGSAITAPATEPTKTGYTFRGWSTDGATVLEDLGTVPVDGKTFIAVFEANDGVDYTVNRHFMTTDGKGYSLPETLSLNGITGAEVTYNVAVTGFTINETLGTRTGTIAGDGSLVLNVYYDRNKVNVTIDETTEEYYYGSTISQPVEPTAPEGNKFDHWEYENGNTVTFPVTVGTEDIVITSVFVAEQYTVSFMANGTVFASQALDFGAAIAAPEGTPTLAGYDFAGWSEDGTTVITEFGTVPVGGKTFTAVYTARTDTAYTVNTYYMNVDGATYAAPEAQTLYGTTGATATYVPVEVEGFTYNLAASTFVGPIAGDGSLVLSVYYDRNKVDVTIDGTTEEYFYDEEITEPDAPTPPEGNSFDHWEDEDGNVVEFPINAPADGIVITPVYTPNNYVVTFMNGDIQVSSAEFAYGSVIVAPQAPEKAGHTFTGWEADGAAFEAGVTTVPVGGITFEAVFAPNNYTVNFVSQGTTVSTQELAFGSAITAPEYEIPSGYNFNGWSTDGVTVLAELGTVPVDGQTFYAVLTPRGDTNYTVNIYYMNLDGIGYGAPVATVNTGATGTTVNYTPSDIKGFTFNAEASSLSVVIAGDGSSVIECYYDRNKVKVTIDGTEGEYFYGSEIEAPADPTPPAGYDYTGWEDGDGNPVTFPITVPADELIINPVYAPKKYEVKFIANGNDYATGSFDYDSAIAAPETNPELVGYTFDGWSKDGVNVITDLGNVPIDGATFYAVFTGNEGIAYTVNKYFQNVDGTDWNAPVVENYTGTAGATASVTLADEAVEGFTIDAENSVASAVINGDGSTVLVIYYLRNTVTVTINGDEGEYYYGDEIPAPQDPAQEGYDFGGWEDGEGNPVAFPITVPDNDLVINPIWNVKSYSLSFEVEGETVRGPETVDFGTAITAPADPEMSGYTFIGWFAKETGEAMPATMPAKDVVYVAAWTTDTNTKYTIEIYMMDTSGNYTMSAATVAYGTTGTTQTITPGAITGCSVNAGLSELSKPISPDGTTTLKIYYDRNLYTVKFDGGAAINVYFGAAIPATDPAAQVGKTFTGWSPEVPATMPAENLEFTSTWSDDAYTITYIINGEQKVESYTYGETVIQPEDPAVDGMTFAGWNSEIPETMPAENLIIVAKFEIAVYKVTFLDAEGAKFDEKFVRFGEEIIIPALTPEKEYYVFTGWAAVPETMPAEDITIAPLFERVAVKLIPKAGSTTVVEDERKLVYGLDYNVSDSTLHNTFLDVEGDGYFVVTPVSPRFYGTGTVVDLYDNVTGELVDTYHIIIFGDLNGDGRINSADQSLAEDEMLMMTNWSSEKTYVNGALQDNPDFNLYRMVAADLNRDGMINASDASDISNVALSLHTIDQATGIVSVNKT